MRPPGAAEAESVADDDGDGDDDDDGSQQHQLWKKLTNCAFASRSVPSSH